MNVVISNYRGVSSAVLDLSKICLVAGQNGGGKSSICQAIASAATGRPIPINDENGNELVKSKAGVLVRSGTATGKAELANAEGATTVLWPKAQVSTTGQPPCCSTFAAGIESLVTMDIKKRTAFLIQYLRANPTKGDLQRALADMNLGWGVVVGGVLNPVPNGRPAKGTDGKMYQPESGTVDKLWELIELQGWDGAHSQIKEKGARLKGQWEAVTHSNYGKKIAESWIPNGYSSDLMGASAELLQACVTSARDSLETAIASTAIDNVRRQELEEFAATLPAKQTALDEAKKPLLADEALKAASLNLQEAKNKLAQAQFGLTTLNNAAPKKGDPPKELFCSCGKKLMLDPQGNLCDYKLGGPTQEELDAHGVKAAELAVSTIQAELAVSTIQAEYDTLNNTRQAAVIAWNNAITLASKAVTEAREAADELAAMGPAVDGPAVDIDACRNDLAAHELRLSAFVAKTKADSLHASIELNQELLKHIAPGGVRAQVLQHALGRFNAVLAHLCHVAGWPVVQIEQDFSFTYQGTPFFLCSGGEMYRVRTVVQLAMAIQEKAAVVICDGADILDKSGRNGLFKLLAGCRIPAVVGMTILEGEAAVPNLARAGYGVSYWLENAVAREVG